MKDQIVEISSIYLIALSPNHQFLPQYQSVKCLESSDECPQFKTFLVFWVSISSFENFSAGKLIISDQCFIFKSIKTVIPASEAFKISSPSET